jgi:hypothetical protein
MWQLSVASSTLRSRLAALPPATQLKNKRSLIHGQGYEED